MHVKIIFISCDKYFIELYKRYLSRDLLQISWFDQSTGVSSLIGIEYGNNLNMHMNIMFWINQLAGHYVGFIAS